MHYYLIMLLFVHDCSYYHPFHYQHYCCYFVAMIIIIINTIIILFTLIITIPLTAILLLFSPAYSPTGNLFKEVYSNTFYSFFRLLTPYRVPCRHPSANSIPPHINHIRYDDF